MKAGRVVVYLEGFELARSGHLGAFSYGSSHAWHVSDTDSGTFLGVIEDLILVKIFASSDRRGTMYLRAVYPCGSTSVKCQAWTIDSQERTRSIHTQTMSEWAESFIRKC